MALVASVSVAQSRKKEKGPRALAVVELPADANSKPRLIPITILVNGRFWDASIYRADPRPMALDPGNVYEVERSGKPVGFFTVGDARRAKDRWIAFGEWQPESEKPPAAVKSAKPRAPEDDERPVLHKRQSSAPEQEARTAPQSAPPAAAPAPPPSPDDPNRPVLRRGKPKPQPQEPLEEELETASPAKPKTEPAAASAAAPVKAREALPAISDAGGPEPRPYAYAWGADEQPKLTKAISDIATAEVARYVKNTPALRFAPAATFDQVSIRAFDLNYDNNPEVVFTARVPAVAPPAARTRAAKPSPPAPDFFFYVTVVGQTDLYGQMRKLFSSVTDSAHLDAYPRLELIDAVDAEGTGRGNLLFRALSGDTPSYQLYHVGPDSLKKLFDSAGE
ncbi:MAG TPA: hypothetical protein VES66_00365 [Terriglobales bacterium]|nr:hypothetical protein [Terriglobales bacterium]